MRTELILIAAERDRQDKKWGEQNHPDGTSNTCALQEMDGNASYFRNNADRKAQRNELTWVDILLEEVAEALEETDPVRLKEELIQVAAVAANWVEAINRRLKREGKNAQAETLPRLPEQLELFPK